MAHQLQEMVEHGLAMTEHIETEIMRLPILVVAAVEHRILSTQELVDQVVLVL